MCIERSFQILHNDGSSSMIVPLAIVCTQRMIAVQKIIECHGAAWYSNFSWRPGKLFDAVNRALTIYVSTKSNVKNRYSTGYLKWNTKQRNQLMPLIRYVKYNLSRDSFWFPKLSNEIELNILEKILASKFIIKKYQGITENKIFYRTTGGLYWKVFSNFAPKFFLNGKPSSSSRETYFSVYGKNNDIQFVALLSSNTFWWWYSITSNLRDVNPSDINGIKFGKKLIEDKILLEIGKRYLLDLKNNSKLLQRKQKGKGNTITQAFKVSKSKEVIDKIDKVLAKHYGFTEKELDFIINYDIKYRMGKELFNNENEKGNE